MTSYLYEHKIRIFDYPKFAEPFRNALRENAERLAAENGMEIVILRKYAVRVPFRPDDSPGLAMPGLAMPLRYMKNSVAWPPPIRPSVSTRTSLN
jgi:hypothetical protein